MSVSRPRRLRASDYFCAAGGTCIPSAAATEGSIRRQDREREAPAALRGGSLWCGWHRRAGVRVLALLVRHARGPLAAEPDYSRTPGDARKIRTPQCRAAEP